MGCKTSCLEIIIAGGREEKEEERTGLVCRRHPLFILSSQGPCKLEKSGPNTEREAKNNHLCALAGINIPAPLGKNIYNCAAGFIFSSAQNLSRWTPGPSFSKGPPPFSPRARFFVILFMLKSNLRQPHFLKAELYNLMN